MSAQEFLIFDIETRSECDLKLAGAWEYSVHPTTEVFCVSWRLGTRETLRTAPVHSWSPITGGNKTMLVGCLLNPDIKLVAHNAGFEQSITKHVLSRVLKMPRLADLTPDRFICTLSLASTHALPRALEGACQALSLDVQKDMEGRRLILKYSKPRKETKNNKNKWHNKLSDLIRIIEYCEADVRAETELFLAAKPLTKYERKVWLLDQRINQRGFYVDRELVSFARAMIDIEQRNIQIKTQQISQGAIASTTQVDATLRWVNERLDLVGVPRLDNLRKQTVYESLQNKSIQGNARAILMLRQSASKTSAKKYDAFEIRSRFDSRLRDLQLYHGASHGRWAGTGLQHQNMPRGDKNIKDTDLLAELIKQGDIELIRLMYGDVMSALSTALRSCITATPGYELFVWDFNAIEARMLFWIAEHEDGLKAYREGRDLYVEMAGSIYSIPFEEIQKDSLHRFLGKTTLLGCGYGQGEDNFIITCGNQGLMINEDTAKLAVKTYRTVHWPVPKLWKNLEKAAIAAVSQPTKCFAINKTMWFMEGKFLICQLPSGRKLYYYEPIVGYKTVRMKDGGSFKAPFISHMGVNALTKQWERQKTWGGILTQNVVSGASRDLLAHAMLNAQDAGFENVFGVHDELACERLKGEATAEEFEKIMTTLPEWASGAPVKAEGFIAERYRK